MEQGTNKIVDDNRIRPLHEVKWQPANLRLKEIQTSML